MREVRRARRRSQRERHNGCAGKGEEFASVHLFHGGAPFCLSPLLFRGLWFGYSLHLQSAPSYAILMNRIRRCLLTRFVHSDRLSAPARDIFCLYCIIPGKKLPPQKSRFWGAIPKKFLGFGASPSKNPPKKPKIGGILGCFPPKQAAAALPVPVFPLWLQCVERNHEKWNEGHF